MVFVGRQDVRVRANCSSRANKKTAVLKEFGGNQQALIVSQLDFMALP